MSRVNTFIGIGHEGRGVGNNSFYRQDIDHVFVGVILGVSGQNSDGYYTTETVRYAIIASLNNASSSVILEDQVPQVRMWPPDQYIDAEKLINKNVVGFSTGGFVSWMFFEPPLVAGCEDPQPLTAPDIVRIEEPQRPFEIVGGGGASGATPTPGPGGEV